MVKLLERNYCIPKPTHRFSSIFSPISLIPKLPLLYLCYVIHSSYAISGGIWAATQP